MDSHGDQTGIRAAAMTDAAHPAGAMRFCRGCRYDLGGLRESRCPECGLLFDGNDPTTYSSSAHSDFREFLAASVRSLAVVIGMAAGVMFLVSIAGTHLLLVWMGALLLIPFSLWVLVVAILPWTPLSRRARLCGIAMVVMLHSIAWTNWPLIASFALHRPFFDRAAERRLAGESIAAPHRIGLYRILRIAVNEDGNVGFQLSGGSGGGSFLVRPVKGAPRVWYNTNWEIYLGGGWRHVYED